MRDKQEMLVMYAVLYPQDDKDEHRSYSMRHFVITDKGNDHLPWDYIIDREIFLEQVAGGSFFPFDFVRHETMDIYLTDNLWTCACLTGPYIHAVDHPSCPRCNSLAPAQRCTGRDNRTMYQYWSNIIRKSADSGGLQLSLEKPYIQDVL